LRVLLDESFDRRLARELSGHEVWTAAQMGWAGLKDRELLERASAEFDVFVTVDRNLHFQQNLRTLAIRIVVLHAKTNRLEDLLRLMPDLVAALDTLLPGALVDIGAPSIQATQS
jgi:predicted nuclease of predicted toxin-antitoxin system